MVKQTDENDDSEKLKNKLNEKKKKINCDLLLLYSSENSIE